MTSLVPGIVVLVIDSLQKSTLILDFPTELQFLVAEHLPSKGLQSVRLVCAAWAGAFAGQLFKGAFAIRPDGEPCRVNRRALPSASRLRNISRHPKLAAGVQHLEIFARDMNLDSHEDLIEDD
jgi:hypothetical protein